MASETTTERTSVFNAQDPQSTLLSVNMSSVTKLTHQNYLMWGRQVRALLEGHELQQFIDGSGVAPAPTIQTDGVTSPNPAYAPWRHQDRLLYSAIIGAISLPLQTLVATSDTTKQVWDSLEETFGKPTRGHIQQLRQQIKTCSKGTKTITEYLRFMKTKSDELALLGKPMDIEDLNEYILGGLTEEYKPEIDAVNGRDLPISFNELLERLLNREAMILCTEPTAVAPIVAHATDTRQRYNNRNHGNNQNHNRYQQHTSHNNHHHHNNHHQPNNQPQHNNRFSKPYLGRCQACGIQGHSAKYCPEYCIVKGNSSGAQTWNHHQNQQSWQPRANAAFMFDPSKWLLDSGASHHMTSDLANLSLHTPYHGGDDVLLGDGSALQITHSGSTSLPLYTKPFFVNNILCVPSLDKNLISVFQLCKANDAAVIFTPTYFQVRDLQAGILRLQGKPKHGTYEWPKVQTSAPPSLAFASIVKTTLTDWHSRLGHLALPILQKVISQFDLPIASNVLLAQPCSACSINKMHKLPFSTSTL